MSPLKRRFLASRRSRDPTNHPSTSLSALKTTLEVFQASVPLPGLRDALGGLLVIVNTAEQTNQNSVEFYGLLSHLSSLRDALLEVIHTEDPPIPDALKGRIEDLISDLYDIAKDERKISPRRFPFLPSSATSDTLYIDGLHRRLKESLDRFMVQGAINMEIQIEASGRHGVKVGEAVDGLHVHMIDQRQSDILNRLRRAPARYDSDLRNSASGCLSGTRVELLRKIETWIEDKDPDTPRIFWLSGLAGTGKSTIAQTLAERCHQRGCLGASFFFSRNDTDCGNSLLVFSTIAYQLAAFNSSFKSSIARALEADADIGRANIRTQLQKLIIEPLREVELPHPVVVVIMDALDECSQDSGASDILRLLASELGKLHFPLKFLITSRPELHIRSKFNTPAIRHVSRSFILHDMESSIVQGDIRRFLRRRFTEVATNFLDGTSWPTEEDLEALVEKAAGLFIFAATAVKFIENKCYGDPKRQLRVLLQDENASGSSPYRDLDRLYLKVLETALPEEADQSLRHRFQLVLGTIVVLLDSLPPPALERLLNLECGSIKVSLTHLHSVIIVPNADDQAIRLIHPSFPDFLTHSDRCSDPRLLIKPEEHHSRLALLCLNCMVSSLKRNICQIEDYSKLNSELGDLNERLARAASPELRYACFHWASHLSQSHKDPAQLEHMRSFCFKYLLQWLELLSLLGRLDVVMLNLRLARSWLRESSHPQDEMNELLDDAQRFVLEFYEPISTSAMHIYLSALPFTPPQTLLFRTFCHELQNSVKVITGPEKEWHPCLCTWEGHCDWVTSVAVSPDGTRVASGSDDKSVRLWDSSTGAVLTTFDGHLGRIMSIAFSPDGTRIVSGSEDKTVRLWDSLTGAALATLVGHSSIVRSVAFSPDGNFIVSGSEDKTVRIWDASTEAAVITLDSPSGGVWSVAFSPHGTHVVSGSDDMTVRLWDLSTKESLPPLEGHLGRVRSVAFSADGTRILSGSSDNSVRLWDSSTRALLATLDGHSSIVTSVAFSQDGTRIVTGSEDKTLRLWNSSNGANLTTLEGHSGRVRSVAFSPGGTRIVSGSDDRTVRLWDSLTGTVRTNLDFRSQTERSVALPHDMTSVAFEDKPVQVQDTPHEPAVTSFEGHSGWVTSVAFSPDGTQVISGSDDKTVRLWDLSTGAVVATLDGHSGVVRSVAFSPDGTRIISGSEDKTIQVWDSSSGEIIATLADHLGWVRSVAFSPDGAYIVSGSEDKTVRLWDSSTWTVHDTFHGHSGIVWSVAFSPDGTHVVSGSEDKTLRLWDTSTGKVVATGEGHSGWVLSAAFLPNGTRIVTGSSDKTVRLWASSNLQILATLHGHSNWVRSVAFSPDGTCIVSGSEDRTVRLWDSSTGTPLDILENHSGKVKSVAFSFDGTRIVSGSGDRTLRLWDSSTRVLLATLGGPNLIRSVAISSDGTRVISGSSGGTIQLWDSLTGEVLATLDTHSYMVQTVAFSSDGTRAVYVLSNKTEHHWDLSTGPAGTLPVQKSNTTSRKSYILDGEWIVDRIPDKVERLCWVPLACRGVAASHWPHFVMGSGQGRVTILDFSCL